MPYTKQTWEDNNLSYPVSAERMSHIEDGIYNARGVADEALSSATAATDAVAGITTGFDSWVAEAVSDDDSDTRAALDAIYDRKWVADIRDFGAVGDGVTDCTAAFSNAIAALQSRGGGTLRVPTGVFYVAGLIELTDNLTIVGDGPSASIISKDGASRTTGVIFRGSSDRGMGYGAGPSNVVIRDLGFRGNFAADRAATVAEFHHSRNVRVHNIFADEMCGSGHLFDLLGVDGFTMTGSTVLGSNAASNRLFTEAVQCDYSSAGGFSTNAIGNDFTTCDGLPTINVTIDGCKFLPKVVGVTTYPAPNPFGSHTAVENQVPYNYRFTNNEVVGWAPDTSSSYNGALHFATGVRGLWIENNLFDNTSGNSTYVLRIYRGAYQLPLADVQNPSPPTPAEGSTRIGCDGVVFSRNIIRGYTNASSGAIVSIVGDSVLSARRVVVSNNSVIAGGTSGSFTFGYCDGLTISGNVFENVSTAIIVGSSTNATISGNSYAGASIEVSLTGSNTNVRRFDAAP